MKEAGGGVSMLSGWIDVLCFLGVLECEACELVWHGLEEDGDGSYDCGDVDDLCMGGGFYFHCGICFQDKCLGIVFCCFLITTSLCEEFLAPKWDHFLECLPTRVSLCVL